MEHNIISLLSLFNWILNKGIKNLQTNTKNLDDKEFISLKVARSSLDLKYQPDFNWGSIEDMHYIIHYSLMLCCGYLLIKESSGWVCFKYGNGQPESRKKYDLPSVQQCSCLRTAYNQGDCKHIKMLKGYLLLQELTQSQYKRMY